MTIDEDEIWECVEEKSMNFKTGNLLRILPPDNERKIESASWERGKEQASKRSALELM